MKIPLEMIVFWVVVVIGFEIGIDLLLAKLVRIEIDFVGIAFFF